MRKLLPALAAVPLAALLAACGSPAPSYPHAWCGPLIAQLHARQTRQAEIDGVRALTKSGAPVTQWVTDETAYAANRDAANSTGDGSFAAVAAGPAALAKVTADLKDLNAQCGQPADAYKSDNA